MIQLTCTKCQAVLQIDDGFAGGVCRCRHCGTIQTVPSDATRKAAPGTQVTSSKPLYEEPAPPQPARQNPTDQPRLDDLASAVASSAASPTSPRPAPPRKSVLPLAIAIGALAVVAIIIAVVLIKGRHPDIAPVPADSPSATSQPTTPGPRAVVPTPDPKTPPAPKRPPAFLGQPLTGPSVIYLIDRGQGTAESFDALKQATLRSIESLPPTTKFQIIFWETDAVVCVPAAGLAYATPQAVTQALTQADDVFAGGTSKIAASLEKAMAANPAQLIIATGKWGLDEEFVTAVTGPLSKSAAKPRVFTFCVGSAGSPDALESVAKKLGGTFHPISRAQLLEAAN